MRVTLLAIAGFAAATVAAVLVAGPALMEIAFGDKFSYDRTGLAIVAAGMGFFLAATTLNQAALAQGQARRAAACWVLCAGGLLASYGLLDISVFRRVELGFAGAAVLLALALYIVYRHPRPNAMDSIEPDSPRELEARLAMADESV